MLRQEKGLYGHGIEADSFDMGTAQDHVRPLVAFSGPPTDSL